MAEISAATLTEMLWDPKTGTWGQVMLHPTKKSSDRNKLKPSRAASLAAVFQDVAQHGGRGFDFCLSCRAWDPSAGAGGACTDFPGWNKVQGTRPDHTGTCRAQVRQGESQGNELQESVPLEKGELQGNPGRAGCREAASGSWAGIKAFHKNRAEGAALHSHQHLEEAPMQETGGEFSI